MMAVPIAENVYWVGAVDWEVRHFHGHSYHTHRGTSYNAYLVVDEQVALKVLQNQFGGAKLW